MEIKLTRGYTALVSAEDYDRISTRKWQVNLSGKPRACRNKTVDWVREVIYMHQEVLEVSGKELRLKGLEIDHIDGNPLNNQRSNLRIVNHTENMRNTARHKARKGYGWNERANQFCCYIDEPGQKRKYIGYARTEAEAIAKVEAARANY